MLRIYKTLELGSLTRDHTPNHLCYLKASLKEGCLIGAVVAVVAAVLIWLAS